MDYWTRVLEEVKNRHNPDFKKYFVHFPEALVPVVIKEKAVTGYQYNHRCPKRYYLGVCFPDIYLTQREFECASWFLMHKSYDAIANKMGLSKRTIECHIASIRDKVGCTSREELLSVLSNETKLSCYFQ
jgi:DNA-binding CsgD family transcriptional regulator